MIQSTLWDELISYLEVSLYFEQSCSNKDSSNIHKLWKLKFGCDIQKESKTQLARIEIVGGGNFDRLRLCCNLKQNTEKLKIAQPDNDIGEELLVTMWILSFVCSTVLKETYFSLNSLLACFSFAFFFPPSNWHLKFNRICKEKNIPSSLFSVSAAFCLGKEVEKTQCLAMMEDKRQEVRTFWQSFIHYCKHIMVCNAFNS